MLRRIWQTSPALAGTGLLMIPVLVGALAGLVIDPRIVVGAPVWLKPAKFAASIAIYTFTLAWIFTFIVESARTRRVVEWITAITMVLEIVIITLQAWRGTTSHFNVGTPMDAALFATMGLAIAVQTISMIAVAVALFRQRFEDAAFGWALRLGVTVTIVGAMTGGVMTRPTERQLADAGAGHQMTISGAHTIGAADGGPGIAATGWSTEHGDLRVPHFVGLHAMQAIPLLALVLAARRLSAAVRARLIVIAAFSYAALYVILLSQALRGEPIVAPGAATIAQLGAWAIVTISATTFALYRMVPARTTASV